MGKQVSNRNQKTGAMKAKNIVWILPLVVAILSFGCESTVTNTTADIQGILYDEATHEVVVGARVETLPFSEVSYSGNDGQFTIRNIVLPQSYTCVRIFVQHEGYEYKIVQCHLRMGDNYNVGEIYLKRATP